MIAYSTQFINDDDLKAVLSALQNDFITQGKLVDEFEANIAKFVGSKYAITFNSATSALNIAYKIIKSSLESSPNEQIEFITTPLTFCATSNMMLENGITPRFCDIDKLGNISIDSIKNAINPKVRAIVSVDYAGNSVNVEEIQKLCKEHNLYFISDSSHSFGGEYKGRKVGQFADMSIFSFHALKPITTIEGGAITTDNEAFYNLAKALRSHGVIKGELWDSEVDRVGHNFRLSDVASALGISQLKRVESFIDKRAEIARIYDERFSNYERFRTLRISKHIKSSYHLYPILLDKILWRHKREIFIKLLERGIGVQVHYKPIYQFQLYKNYNPIKNVDDFYNAELSIPCHQKMSENEVESVIDSLFAVLNRY